MLGLKFNVLLQGIFRVCFPYERKPPIDGRLYLNPVEEWCKNVDYYVKLLELPILPERLTHQGEIWYENQLSIL